MSDAAQPGLKHKTGSLGDQTAKKHAKKDGLLTDEGVNEDRTGAHGPTLEEGTGEPQHSKAQRRR